MRLNFTILTQIRKNSRFPKTVSQGAGIESRRKLKIAFLSARIATGNYTVNAAFQRNLEVHNEVNCWKSNVLQQNNDNQQPSPPIGWKGSETILYGVLLEKFYYLEWEAPHPPLAE